MNTSAKQRRKAFTAQFFRQNHLMFVLAMIATFFMAIGNLVISWVMQQIIDIASGGTTAFSLAQISLITAGTVLFLVFSFLIDFYASPRFLKRAMQQYKDYAFEEITKKSISSFQSENTSTYISALSNDATTIETSYLCKLFTLVMECVMFVGAFAMMIYYSPLLTLIAFGLSIIPVIASVLTGNKLAPLEKNVSKHNDSFVGMLKDSLSGFSVIKSFKAEREILRIFTEANHKAEEAKRRRYLVNQVIQAIGMITGVIAQFGVFLFGAYLALSGKGISAGIVIVFVQLMNFVLTPISSIPTMLAGKKAAYGLIDKLADALSKSVRREGKVVDNVLDCSIDVRHLSFSYEADKPILNDINCCFEAGKSYAIVGGSGSGKSTLLNLLMGSSEDYQGEICYDDDELRSIHSDSLYDLVSIVQQNVFVFNSSVRDNITMFRSFDEEIVERAIQMSGLSTLMEERGLSYSCGENGSALSGGERQRISIARCLLRNTPVLLVDEATAALDSATAYEVTNSILAINDLTRIIVTHRLEASLLEKYDKILVMKNGSIEEAGSFKTLMEQKGYFYSLYTVAQ